GGFLGSLIGIGDLESAFDIGTIITAVVGALIVLFIYGAVTGRKGRATR
ncbi:GlsB/YeaQ/YmgE family stress response membrane protein, partial [Kocuria rosea]